MIDYNQLLTTMPEGFKQKMVRLKEFRIDRLRASVDESDDTISQFVDIAVQMAPVASMPPHNCALC